MGRRVRCLSACEQLCAAARLERPRQPALVPTTGSPGQDLLTTTAPPPSNAGKGDDDSCVCDPPCACNFTCECVCCTTW